MSNQQTDAGTSMPDEQVDKQPATQEDTLTTEQQAPVDKTTSSITYSRISPWEIPVLKELQEKLRNIYTSMVEHYSKGDVKKGQELAHKLVLSGAYPEAVHARLFLAQGTQDTYMHAREAVSEAISGAAKYKWKDPEAKKLLDLTLLVLNQVRSEEGLGMVEEVDEDEAQAKGVAQEAEKEDLKCEKAEGSAKLNVATVKAKSGKR